MTCFGFAFLDPEKPDFTVSLQFVVAFVSLPWNNARLSAGIGLTPTDSLRKSRIRRSGAVVFCAHTAVGSFSRRNRPMRLLIADDDLISLKMLESVLSAHGY